MRERANTHSRAIAREEKEEEEEENIKTTLQTMVVAGRMNRKFNTISQSTYVAIIHAEGLNFANYSNTQTHADTDRTPCPCISIR